jgi:hypothetical protein
MSPLSEFSSELDICIKKATSFDVFALPMDQIDDLDVEPISSVYCEGPDDIVHGLHFILKIVTASGGEAFYCRVTSGDGGVMVARSEFRSNMQELMGITNNEWTYF